MRFRDKNNKGRRRGGRRKKRNKRKEAKLKRNEGSKEKEDRPSWVYDLCKNKT